MVYFLRMRLPVSSRKLFRLGVLIATSMTVILFYLAFQDVFSGRNGHLTVGRRYGVASPAHHGAGVLHLQHGHIGDDQYEDFGETLDQSQAQIFRNKPSLVDGHLGIQDVHHDVEDIKLNDQGLRGGDSKGRQLENDFSLVKPKLPFISAVGELPHKQLKDSLVNNDRDLSLVPFSSKVSQGPPLTGLAHSKVKTMPNGKTQKHQRKRVKGAVPPPFDPMVKRDQGYIVYECDNATWCGGWGDRQRGITSLHLLALLTNRKLKVNMITPCNLNKFYVPNLVPWVPRPGELSHLSNSYAVNTFLSPQFRLALTDGDFNVKFPQRVIYFKTNQDFFMVLKKNPIYWEKLKQWPGIFKREGRFRWAWSEVMRPSSSLLARLELILGTNILIRHGIITQSLLNPADQAQRGNGQVGNSNLICAHVRMGRNPTIPVDEDFASFNITDLPILHNFLLSKDITGDAKFFVATDSDYVREQSKLFFDDRFVEYGGKIIHIDRQRDLNSACSGFEVALLDQLILSVCDVLVVSRSGFSIHAAQVNNSTHPMYVLEDGNISRLSPS